ncbi:MAG: collagen triple helix repeat protein [crAssphage sp. isolate ctbg_1]|uniref:Collagen triple helix repeat protein n=1 Tax=crAssphage sp. isolate ctbg_1 TaxID=2989854 RepID=A0A345MT50_9CAUD|nr:MAG: collagen triple helix repeat protein [crAssphage sp. isolate ctbg_1]AXH74550.1 MAG: collagen triple helix repeat protein [crAssphage sp. isolate ctbg_1]
MKGSQLFVNGCIDRNYLSVEDNHFYLKTLATRDETLAQVPYNYRHKGLWVTYIDKETKEAVTLIYDNDCIENTAWTNIDNWKNVSDIIGSGDGNGGGNNGGEIVNLPLSLRASAKEGNEAGATVTKVSDSNEFELAFTIPRGAAGPQGPQGIQGPQGEPGRDGRDGTDGKDGEALPGLRYEHRFALSSKTSAPIIDVKSRIPGNNWLTTYPTITNKNTQGIWITSAQINADDTLASDWTPPILYISYGIDGTDGAQGPAGPQGPAGEDGQPGKDASDYYIGDDFCWWINGETTGKPAYGEGVSTGTPPEIPDFYSYVYYRGASKPASLNNNGTDYKTIDDILRNTAWEDFPVGDGPWWQTTLLIDGTLRTILKISDPLPFNQEGEAGSDGIWTKMMFMWYFVGTGYSKINWDAWHTANKGNANPNTAQTSFEVNPGKCPGAEKDYQYMMISAQFKTIDGVQTMMSDWSYPVNIKGEQGVAGPAGQRGPILYPAGQFAENTTYTRTEDSAPYVYYNGLWYWLSTLGEWKSTNATTKNPSNSAEWSKFSQFEAIFAKIGIIGNGLIGQAVFNGNWMFSQRGIDVDGNASSAYNNFNPDNPYFPTNTFRPSYALNFKTGQIYFNKGDGVLDDHGITFSRNGYTMNIDDERIEAYADDGSYSFRIDKIGVAINNGNTKDAISLRPNGIYFYENLNKLTNNITPNGGIINNLTIRNFKRTLAQSMETDGYNGVLNGCLITNGGTYRLPALTGDETLDIIVNAPTGFETDVLFIKDSNTGFFFTSKNVNDIYTTKQTNEYLLGVNKQNQENWGLYYIIGRNVGTNMTEYTIHKIA